MRIPGSLKMYWKRRKALEAIKNAAAVSPAVVVADGGRAATSLTVRGYGLLKSSLTPAALSALKKELTMTPISTNGPGDASSASFPVYQESANKIYIPKYFGLQRYGEPQRRELGEGEPFPSGPGAVKFAGSLRPEQMKPIEAYLHAAHDPMRMGGILSLPCGAGKTVIALHIVAALGRRTLIVVHKDFLLNQWRERIAEFIPGASIGLVKAKTVDVTGRDVVIASLQSLSMKDYPADMFAGIGLLVIDECHRVGTEVFSRALAKTNFRYSLGLSATVVRKDGMTKAFINYLGDVLYKGKRREDTVDVVQHSFYDPDQRYCRNEVIGGLGKPNVSRMINNICAFEPRTRLIVDAILRLLQHEPGRKVLVLSDRKSQLTDVHSWLVEAGVTVGFYWGGMKAAALAETETKTVMCATFSYAAEGMDVPHLDTLFLASPKSDIEQSCGRILRQKEGCRARTPLIFDVIDGFSMFVRQASKRRAFYKKHAYRIASSLDDVIGRCGDIAEDLDEEKSGDEEGLASEFAFLDVDDENDEKSETP